MVGQMYCLLFVILRKIKIMKNIILLCSLTLFTIGCQKKQSYLCTGTINGNMGMWSPSNGEPITKSELNKTIAHSKELGYTDIKCVAK